MPTTAVASTSTMTKYGLRNVTSMAFMGFYPRISPISLPRFLALFRWRGLFEQAGDHDAWVRGRQLAPVVPAYVCRWLSLLRLMVLRKRSDLRYLWRIAIRTKRQFRSWGRMSCVTPKKRLGAATLTRADDDHLAARLSSSRAFLNASSPPVVPVHGIRRVLGQERSSSQTRAGRIPVHPRQRDPSALAIPAAACGATGRTTAMAVLRGAAARRAQSPQE